MKLWGGRFREQIDQSLEVFGASIHFDKVLWQDDILGSQAHVNGLRQAKVLTEEEAVILLKGLQTLKDKINQGEASFKMEDEDIHMNIERLLFQEIGELAGKIHTGRSRNDQVALDMRLYMRHQIILLIKNMIGLQQSLINNAKNHMDIIFPGYTHLQRAQPVRLAHHWLAYVWMFFRDIKRLQQNFISTNKCPLGAGALAGSSFPIDQHYLASLLNFDEVYENSIDAVSDRDYLVEFLAHAALIMMHMSKLCEELILWSTQEFSYIELDDTFCTGSSMMPQKKNPDAAELIRGKTGRVYGALISLLTTLKGLPLAYNKDLQEDKEGILDTINTLNPCINIMSRMVASLKLNHETIKASLDGGFLNATELANYLVKKGIPFRQAHEIIGNVVKYSLTHNLPVNKELLQIFSPLFEDDVINFLSSENIANCPQTACGSSKIAVTSQLKLANMRLAEISKWLDSILIAK